MQPSRAQIGMQKHNVTCAVEVACFRYVSGSQQLVDYAVTLARNPNINGVLHWGQRNDYNMADVESIDTAIASAPRAAIWETAEALSRITANGRLDGFSSDFTRRTGLEVVRPRIAQFAIDRPAVSIGQSVTVHWNCLDNPPESRVSILLSHPTAGSTVINTVPLTGQYQLHLTEAGTHVVNFYLTLTRNGVLRQDSRTAFISVS